MSKLIVPNSSKFFEYELLDESINLWIFHLDIQMFKIRQYDGIIESLLEDEKHLSIAYNEFKDAVAKFSEVAKELETLLPLFFQLERDLNLPTKFAYRRLLSSIKRYPIPKL